MNVEDHNHDITAARQDMLIKYTWSSQETVKHYRLRIPVIIGFVNLGIVSFFYQSESIPSSDTDKVIFGIANLLVMGLGLMGLYSVHLTYKLFGNRMKHLYKSMSMNNEKFFPDETVYFAWKIWLSCYLSIIAFGLFSAISVFLKPIITTTC